MNEPQFLHMHQGDALVLNELCRVVNDWATKKGWNETPDSISHKAEQLALMHSELSECLEFIRAKPTGYICAKCNNKDGLSNLKFDDSTLRYCNVCDDWVPYKDAPMMDDHVPSLTGEAAELADVLIRIFHYCGKRGINLGEAVRLKHEYNIMRPYKHGKLC